MKARKLGTAKPVCGKVEMHTAIKDHVCGICEGSIYKGTSYTVFYPRFGTVYRKAHSECFEDLVNDEGDSDG